MIGQLVLGVFCFVSIVFMIYVLLSLQREIGRENNERSAAKARANHSVGRNTDSNVFQNATVVSRSPEPSRADDGNPTRNESDHQSTATVGPVWWYGGKKGAW